MQQGRAAGAIAPKVRRRFGDSTAQAALAYFAACQDTAQLEEIGEWVIDCADAQALLGRLRALKL